MKTLQKLSIQKEVVNMKNIIAWIMTATAAFISTLFLALSGVYFTTLFVLVILIEIAAYNLTKYFLINIESEEI